MTSMHMYEPGKGWDRVVRHAFVLLGGGAPSALLVLATLSITARSLPPAAFGMLVIAQTYALRGLIRLGRRLDLAGAVIGSTCGVPIAMLAGHRFGWEPRTSSMAMAYGGSVLLRMTGTSLAVLRLSDRFDQTAVARAASGIIRLAATGVAVIADASLPVFVAVWIVGDIVPPRSWRSLPRARFP
jgi:O-antigen/teichoic acid export membrane protein